MKRIAKGKQMTFAMCLTAVYLACFWVVMEILRLAPSLERTVIFVCPAALAIGTTVGLVLWGTKEDPKEGGRGQGGVRNG